MAAHLLTGTLILETRGIARPPPLHALQRMYPVLLQVLQPTSPSLQRWHMQGSKPVPLHTGQDRSLPS